MGNETRLKLDLARATNDALDTYKRHFFTFLMAAIVFDVLSVCSAFILTGPLWGGIVLMCLRVMSDPKAEPRLGDMFGAFHRFWPLLGLFVITTIAVLAGLAVLIVPGLIVAGLWLFPVYLMLDQNMGVMDSLGTSARIVIRRGLWINVAAAFVIMAIAIGPSLLLPYVGPLVSMLVAPLVWLINTSCYIQEVREQYDVTDFAPRGFPVQPPPFAQPAPQG